jgi:hypothetical protein
MIEQKSNEKNTGNVASKLFTLTHTFEGKQSGWGDRESARQNLIWT